MRSLLRLWARFTGRVLISDYVTITVSLSNPGIGQSKFNPDTIIGRPHA